MAMEDSNRSSDNKRDVLHEKKQGGLMGECLSVLWEEYVLLWLIDK